MTWELIVEKIVSFFHDYWLSPRHWEQFERQLRYYLKDKKGTSFKLFADYHPYDDLALIINLSGIEIEYHNYRPIIAEGKFGIYGCQGNKIEVKVARGRWAEPWYYE